MLVNPGSPVQPTHGATTVESAPSAAAAVCVVRVVDVASGGAAAALTRGDGRCAW